MTNMALLIDEEQAAGLAHWQSLTKEQRLEEKRLHKIKQDYEALHTPIETDEDRADTDEYPEDDND